MCVLFVLLCYVLLVAVEETRIYRAGGWVEFNRVNGERCKTAYCTYAYMYMYACTCVLASLYLDIGASQLCQCVSSQCVHGNCC